MCAEDRYLDATLSMSMPCQYWSGRSQKKKNGALPSCFKKKGLTKDGEKGDIERMKKKRKKEGVEKKERKFSAVADN